MIELVAGMFTSLFGALGIAVMIVLWFVFLAVIGFGLWWYRLHTIDIDIFDEANETTRPAGTYRARYTQVAGIPCVKFMNWWIRKHIAPLPDKDSLIIGKNGRWHLLALRKANEQYSYFKIDPTTNAKVKGISTNLKMLYLKNYQEANKKRKITWQEALPVIANSIAFIVLIVILLVMAPSIYDKHGQITGQQQQITQLQVQGMTVLAQACSNSQFIKSNNNFLDGTNQSTPPASTNNGGLGIPNIIPN